MSGGRAGLFRALRWAVATRGLGRLLHQPNPAMRVVNLRRRIQMVGRAGF